jgi:hypothetical protein
MSYASYLNSPFYVASGTEVPANVQTFYNTTEVQAYLDNDPTTSYTVTNLYNNLVTDPSINYYAQDVLASPVNDFKYIQILQSVYDADPDNVDILDATIPAGTYNLSFTGTICVGNLVDTYINTALLLVYDRSGGDADADCPLGIANSSSGSYYNTVNDPIRFIVLKGFQRVVFTVDTVVSMVLRVEGVSNDAIMYYGNTITNNIIETASFTFTPTI